MTQKEWTQQLQLALGLTPDGVFGPITEAKSGQFEISIILKDRPKVIFPGPVAGAATEYFGATWVGANIDLLGRDETDAELNRRYVPEWRLENLPEFKTLSGNAHPWCSVKDNADKRKVGVKGTGSAAAASHRTWGRSCPYWFGSTLGLRHASGGAHVTTFLYWVDKNKKIGACYGGNQSNKLSVAAYNLSGNASGHDEVVNGPRWSKEWPDGQEVSMEEVLAKYPFLKVGGIAGSTR